MIEVELPNGDTVDFPDGTPDDVMNKAVKEFMGRQGGISNNEAPTDVDDNVTTPGAAPSTETRTGGAKGVELADRGHVVNGSIDFGRGALQGVTLGFGDEILGAGEAGVREGLSWLGIGEDMDVADRYTQARDEYRALDQASAERSPVLNTIGEGAGMVGGMLIPGGAAAKGLSMAGKAALGSATGAAYGAGKSDADNLGEFSQDVGMGALTGAAAGPAGRLIGKVAKPVGGAIARGLGKGLEQTGNVTNFGTSGIVKGAANRAKSAFPLVDRATSAIDKSVQRGLGPRVGNKVPGQGDLFTPTTLGGRIKEGIKSQIGQTYDDMGGSAGIAIGAPTVGIAPTTAAVGARLGRAQQGAGKWLQNLPELVQKASSHPKWGPRLQTAAGKGDQALQAASYIAMNDPEFREMMGISLNEDN